MFTKLKEGIKERIFKTKQFEMEKILNKRIYHLLYESTTKEVIDIEKTIKEIIDDLNKL